MTLAVNVEIVSHAKDKSSISYCFIHHYQGKCDNIMWYLWPKDRKKQNQQNKMREQMWKTVDPLTRIEIIEDLPHDTLMVWTERGLWRRGACCCHLCPRSPTTSNGGGREGGQQKESEKEEDRGGHRVIWENRGLFLTVWCTMLIHIDGWECDSALLTAKLALHAERCLRNLTQLGLSPWTGETT